MTGLLAVLVECTSVLQGMAGMTGFTSCTC